MRANRLRGIGFQSVSTRLRAHRGPFFAAASVLIGAAAVVWAQTAATSPSGAPGAVPAAPPRPTAGAVSPLDGLLISELNILGLEQLDEAYVRNQIRSRAGQAYSQEQVQGDVSRLLRTGRFIDVRPEAEPVNGQVRLTFRVAEKPEIAAIEFVGNQEFKVKDLMETLTFGPGDPLDLYEIRRAQEAIQRKYMEKGYAYVQVTYDEDLLKTERRVVYTIVENQRVKVRKVRFEGHTAFSESELKGEVETKSWIPIFRTGDYDPDRAQRDAAKVQQYYRERGYLDAEVTYVPQFLDVAREKMEVVFRVSEGVRYNVREIRIRGNHVLSTEEIVAMMTLKEGDPFVDAHLRADLKAIQTKYGSQGYIYATVAPSWVFADEPAQVILTLTITEGDQFTVGWIEVNGNLRTQEKCVRRELRFHPEEIYDTTRTDKAEKRLKDTGLFTEATIEPMEPADNAPGVRDALVTVTENPQTTNFIAGVGASSDSGIVGNIVLENKNFDIADWPRNAEEFFKGRAFRGAGQTMRLQLEPGTEFNRFRIDFREPYLMDQPIGFGTSLYLFERGRDGYDEVRMGGDVSFDHAFEEGLLSGWVGEIALRGEYVDVQDVQAFAAKDIRKVEGGNFLTSIKVSLLHDTTDSRLNPSVGHRFNVSWEQAGAMGGDFFYSKANMGFTRHWTVAIDEQDRRSIVSAYARGGQIFGDAPVFERFYAGGIGSLRGFDFRGISPRQGLRHNRVGGDFMLLTGAEYSFPLVAKAVRGVFFTDMGTVEEEFGIKDWRAAVGGGVRLTLDILGTVPMEFDLAYPLAKDDDDDTRIFSFFIGLPFL